MSERDDWGPWIEHDGKGAPVGFYVRAVTFALNTLEGMVTTDALVSDERAISRWVFDTPDEHKIHRYQIRRPRALQQMVEMVENLPAPARETEPA